MVRLIKASHFSDKHQFEMLKFYKNGAKSINLLSERNFVNSLYV